MLAFAYSRRSHATDLNIAYCGWSDGRLDIKCTYPCLDKKPLANYKVTFKDEFPAIIHVCHNNLKTVVILY